MKELDTVVLSHDIDEQSLKEGDVGAVVHVYPKAKVCEVEFVTGNGETIAILSLSESEIRTIANQEILHVRELQNV